MDEKRSWLEPDRELSIATQAKLLGIARSSAYYMPTESPQNVQIMHHLDEIYTELPFYGSRRMVDELSDRFGLTVNRKRVQRLMRVIGLEAIYPKKSTSTPHPNHSVYPYLLRGVTASYPNHIWGTDITYIRLRGGFCYLVTLLDWYSRYVVSWELSPNLEDDFCITNLNRALSNARPEIHNSDQGSQFTSHDYLRVLRDTPTTHISMDGRGRYLDNIFTERLWRTVKYEDVYLKDYTTINEVREGLTDYFNFYNHRRRHSSLQKYTPAMIYFGYETLET